MSSEETAKKYIKNRLDDIMTLLHEVASGNFDHKIDLGDEEDEGQDHRDGQPRVPPLLELGVLVEARQPHAKDPVEDVADVEVVLAHRRPHPRTPTLRPREPCAASR